MKAVVFMGAGGNEVVRLEDRPEPEPGTGEVVVSATHAGLNPADVVQRGGGYASPPGAPADIPGLEVAGRVVALGPGVTIWRTGDRVFGIVGGGGLAERVVCHERHLAPVPDGLDAEAAAAVPEAFITAHDALFTQAQLLMGETLLVNGASGAVGTSAVQLAREAGARVFAGVRSEAARQGVASLGATVVGSDFAERLIEVGGADVVLELVGAPNLVGDLEALALRGRIAIVGTGAGAEGQISLRKLMGKRARIFGTVLRARPLEEKALAVQALAHSVVPLLAQGRVKPIIDRVFPVAEVTSAFDYLGRPGKFGKVLIAF
jgi:putative PIG3 family NAD(P)H quinone oxidoreductase